MKDILKFLSIPTSVYTYYILYNITNKFCNIINIVAYLLLACSVIYVIKALCSFH